MGDVDRLAGLLPVYPGFIHSHTPVADLSMVEIGGIRTGWLNAFDGEGPNYWILT